MSTHPFFGVFPPGLRSAVQEAVPVEVTVRGVPVDLALTDSGAMGRGGGVLVDVDVVRSGDGHGIEWTTRITNLGESTATDIEVKPIQLVFGLPSDDTPSVRHLSGSWHYDALYPPRAFRLHEEAFLTHDHARRVEIGGANAGVHSPILQVGLGIPLREAFFVALEWSAGWALSAGWSQASFSGEPRPSFSVDGHADVGPIEIAPSATVRFPTVHLGASAVGDWQDLDQLQRRRLRDMMPTSSLPSPLPVSFDTWFGRYHRFNIDTLKADAVKAAEIGAEVFCLDACWYKSRDVSDGIGNWSTPDPERFPNGEQDIIELAEHVRSLGMKFGLWPLIQLGLPGTDAVTAKPHLYRESEHDELRDYRNRKFGNLGGVGAPAFKGLLLALEKPEAVEYALSFLEYWIEKWGVEWFRFESVPEDGLEYNLGYNRILQTLTHRHPNLYIEICNGGGQRLDVNSIRLTHGNWLSDHSSSPEVCRFQQTGAARFWPSRMLNMSVTAFEGQGDRQATRHEVISRMAGVLSFNGSVAEWSADAMRVVRETVDVYKSIRHLVDDDVYFPLPQPRDVNGWDVVVYSDRARKETIALTYRLGGERTTSFAISWLSSPSAELLLASDDGASATTVGSELEVALEPWSSAVWRIHDAEI